MLTLFSIAMRQYLLAATGGRSDRPVHRGRHDPRCDRCYSGVSASRIEHVTRPARARTSM